MPPAAREPMWSWPSRRSSARALETGKWDGLVSRTLASAFAPIAARGLVRPASVPSDVALVCVGGATLGGSGKTRVAIACARELSERLSRDGRRVAFVGHAYRAAPSKPQVVAVDARAVDVGDEAVVCARALAPADVPVVIGPTRQAAIDLAVSSIPRPSVLVLDGPLRVRGRARDGSLSLLAVDANRPWGSGRLPPAGDLKAPRERLLAEADLVVPVDATPSAVAWPDGSMAPLESLRGLRLGLFTAIARPDRLVRALSTSNLRPCEIVSISDHGPLTPADRVRLLDSRVDRWIATAKCRLHLEGAALGVPPSQLGTLLGGLAVSPALARALDAIDTWTREAERERG